jgi:hypothetical protein
MTQFEELDEMLTGEYSSDYWSDDVVVSAGELVDNFQPSDWDAARSLWKSRPETWQGRFAEVLSRGPSEVATPMLAEMIELGSDDLALAAADSLRSFDEELPAGALTDNARSRLEGIAAQSRLNKLVVDALLKKISA